MAVRGNLALAIRRYDDQGASQPDNSREPYKKPPKQPEPWEIIAAVAIGILCLSWALASWRSERSCYSDKPENITMCIDLGIDRERLMKLH